MSKKRVLEFCIAWLAKRLKIEWECNTRVDLIGQEMPKKMKKAGCNSIKAGVASGREEILAKMNKGIALD